MQNLGQHYKQKNVLVTGGAGFIGSHLAEQLVSLGAHVTILDDLSSGIVENLRSILHKVSIVVGDITNENDCKKAIRHKSHVFHLAAMTSVPDSVKRPDLCHKINVSGTKNLLEQASLYNVDHFVLSSSSAVYGDNQGPHLETATRKTLSPYAESKALGEDLCKKHAHDEKLNTTCLRYFNVYGPRQNPESQYAAVVALFTKLLKEGKPLTIFGDGTQTRDFVPVHEVVHANLLAGSNENSKGEIYNIGSGRCITILQLIEQLEQQLGVKNVGINFLPPRDGDILHSKADCSKYYALKHKRGYSHESGNEASYY